MSVPSDPSVSPPLTSGVTAFDSLIGQVQVGDNLVLYVGDDTPTGWFVDAFVAASAPGRLIVADTTGVKRALQDNVQVLDWSQAQGSPEQAAALGRAEFDRAEASIGSDGRVVVDSLTGVAAAWGSQPAMDLFLVECPRLFRRRSIALWIVRRSGHERSFLEQLRAVTQVVVGVDIDGDEVHMQVEKAVGRPSSVTGRTLRARIVDDRLVDVDNDWVHLARLGATIRQLRARHSIGQAELARRVGISPSALSQAERGVRGVSGETVLRLWEAVGSSLLTSSAVDLGYRIGRRTSAEQSLGRSVIGRPLVSSPRSSSWEVVFDGRGRGSGPLLPVKGVETIVMHQGVLQVDFGGESTTLHAGDAVVLESVQLDGWENPADSPAIATWIITN